MELKEFIKAAITDITEAVSELQSELNNGAVVSPPVPYADKTKTIENGGMNRLITEIDFDVAITVGNTNSYEGKAKAGIQIFSAKITGENATRTENASRMTFSIPVIFPTAKIKTDKELFLDQAKEQVESMRPKSPRRSDISTSHSR